MSFWLSASQALPVTLSSGSEVAGPLPVPLPPTLATVMPDRLAVGA